MKLYFVYSISVNDIVIYYGQTGNIFNRISVHITNSSYNRNYSNSQLYIVLNQCLYDNIIPKFTIVYFSDKQYLCQEKERYLIDKNKNTTYNCTKKEFGKLKFKISNEVKKSFVKLISEDVKIQINKLK